MAHATLVGVGVVTLLLVGSLGVVLPDANPFEDALRHYEEKTQYHTTSPHTHETGLGTQMAEEELEEEAARQREALATSLKGNALELQAALKAVATQLRHQKEELTKEFTDIPHKEKVPSAEETLRHMMEKKQEEMKEMEEENMAGTYRILDSTEEPKPGKEVVHAAVGREAQDQHMDSHPAVFHDPTPSPSPQGRTVVAVVGDKVVKAVQPPPSPPPSPVPGSPSPSRAAVSPSSPPLVVLPEPEEEALPSSSQVPTVTPVRTTLALATSALPASPASPASPSPSKHCVSKESPVWHRRKQ
eukprot:TRINITY_DN8103_c0_g1_i1.p1 TRINITY_DN8103_c0_g1~~TRINITY_DN8103_c0_g1_i1.p1  ORF type:complete len:312 (-),score=87.45 TRINITY_DN8103_c0_g1_i1:85-990(-)